jgi:oxygen-independent coproporphyrinogen III oxidase
VHPTGAYVHVPFCRRLCPYCDFFVVIEKAGQRERFLERLLAEIRSEAPVTGPLETVYLGGGTPSELGAAQIGSILGALRERFGVAPDAEVTLEANPETVRPEGLEALLEAGVTRLSLGVQAFDEEALRWLGRRHGAAEAAAALEHTRRAGFRSFSVDLIHGVPGLDLERSLASVRTAVELGAPHVSHYGLTYHEGTSLGRKLAAGRVRAVPDELEADIFEAAAALLEAAGLQHYEVSNFARPGHRSRHNLACWLGQEYLAFGPSAVGFVGGRRYRNPSALTAWLQGAAREPESVSPRETEVESVIAGLRLVREGLSRPAFEARNGRDVTAAFPRAVARGQELGLLELAPEALRLRGLRAVLLYDSVLGLFVDEPSPP